MNFLDASVFSVLQTFSQSSKTFNLFLHVISNNDLCKGVFTMAVFWWAWFRGEGEERERSRQTLVLTLLGAFVALFLGRLLQVTLPFRARPFNEHGIQFQLPVGTESKMEEWSSFPSDHSALFYSLATGLFLISRSGGLLAFVYLFFAICFPRMYLGLHYPTDILAGIVLGVLSTLVCNNALFRSRLATPLLAWADRHPSLFYGALFFLTFELATLFDSLREMGSFVVHGKVDS